MINKQSIKVSKRIAIMLLIAIFSIAGIVACGGAEDISGSKGGDIVEAPAPGKTGFKSDLPSWGANYIPKQTPKATFPEDTYMTVYSPWRGENYPKVSWQDSETLTMIWKEMISKKWNKNQRWFVKGASYGNWDYNPDSWKDPGLFYYPPEYNYYYFDQNFDIVYYKDLKKTSIKLMKLVGATIVRWNKEKKQGNNPTYVGTWTVGGIYQTILTYDEIKNIDNNDVYFFTRAEHMPSRNNKPLQVVTMNLGYNDRTFAEFGIDMYYNTTKGEGYYNNITEFTNKSPKELDNFLNCKINLSWEWNIDWHNWRFFSKKPEAWHLQAHPDKGWVKR